MYYEKTKIKIKTLLEEANWISFTTNMWSNPAETKFYRPLHLKWIAHKSSPWWNSFVTTSEIMYQKNWRKLSHRIQYWIKKSSWITRQCAANMDRAIRMAIYFFFRLCCAHIAIRDQWFNFFSSTSRWPYFKMPQSRVGHFYRSESARRYLSSS